MSSRKAWDAEYREGLYVDQPPVGFAGRILQILSEHRKLMTGIGLYVGCGNGRNFAPLAESGLVMDGIDVSCEAIRQLSARIPHLAGKLVCADYADWKSSTKYDYIISIQSFQHGARAKTEQYFANAQDMLKPGGLLFLRVNSASTDVELLHTITERDGHGGFTVRYREGPKKDLDIRFYSLYELESLCSGMTQIELAREDFERRPSGRIWAQWEMILQKPR